MHLDEKKLEKNLLIPFDFDYNKRHSYGITIGSNQTLFGKQMSVKIASVE